MNEIQDSTLSDTLPRTISAHASKKAKKSEKLIDLAYERLTEVKDEYHHWGMTCAADLRKMEKTQQFYAKKAIAEIIMEGQLGLLHRHSVHINENSPFTSPVQYGASPSPQHSNYMPSPSYMRPPPPPPNFRNPTPSNSNPLPHMPVNPIPSPSYEQYTSLEPSPASAQIVVGPESTQIIEEFPVINIPNLQSIGDHREHNLNDDSQLL